MQSKKLFFGPMYSQKYSLEMRASICYSHFINSGHVTLLLAPVSHSFGSRRSQVCIKQGQQLLELFDQWINFGWIGPLLELVLIESVCRWISSLLDWSLVGSVLGWISPWLYQSLVGLVLGWIGPWLDWSLVGIVLGWINLWLDQSLVAVDILTLGIFKCKISKVF